MWVEEKRIWIPARGAFVVVLKIFYLYGGVVVVNGSCGLGAESEADLVCFTQSYSFYVLWFLSVFVCLLDMPGYR